jgi:hypothetical protein
MECQSRHFSIGSIFVKIKSHVRAPGRLGKYRNLRFVDSISDTSKHKEQAFEVHESLPSNSGECLFRRILRHFHLFVRPCFSSFRPLL